jgi:hypothetical protein
MSAATFQNFFHLPEFKLVRLSLGITFSQLTFAGEATDLIREQHSAPRLKKHSTWLKLARKKEFAQISVKQVM